MPPDSQGPPLTTEQVQVFQAYPLCANPRSDSFPGSHNRWHLEYPQCSERRCHVAVLWLPPTCVA